MLKDVGSIKVPPKQMAYALEHALRVSLEFASTGEAPDWCKPADGKECTRDVDGSDAFHIESVAKWMADC